MVSMLGGWLFDFRALREGRLGGKLSKVKSLGVLRRESLFELLNARPQIKNTNPRWKNSRLTGSDCPCGNKQRVRLYFDILIEGTLEVKPPTIRTDGKAEVGRVREEKTRREKIREEKVRRKKMQPREKVQKSRFKFNVFFQSFVALEGRKVGSLSKCWKPEWWSCKGR